MRQCQRCKGSGKEWAEVTTTNAGKVRKCPSCGGEGSIMQVTLGLNPPKMAEWPDPTPEMLETPEFNAIWDRIKTWDINVPEVDGDSYTGATGNHVRAILEALEKVCEIFPRESSCNEEGDNS